VLDKYLNPKYFFPSIFFLSLIVFLLHTAYTKTSIFADARYYYSITHSIISDKDLDFSNEYGHFGIQMPLGKSGAPTNFYPPGVSFFWIFGLWLTQAINVDPSGYGFFSQLGVALTSIFLGILGLIFLRRMLLKYFSKTVSLLTVVTLFSATNLLFYIAVEPINSHAVSFFVSTLFVYYFLNHQKDNYYYLSLGLIAGVAGLVRTQDLALLTLPLIKLVLFERSSLKKLTSNFLYLTAGTFLGFFPQLILWKYFYGTFWVSPYLDFGFDFLHPKIIYVLFNSQNGLFTITPIIAFAILGQFYFAGKNFYLSFLSLSYFILQLYLISSWNAYFQGGSFAIRMIITTYPLLSLGLASLIERLIQKFAIQKTLFLIIIFSIVNSFMVIRYLLTF